ncbi:MAG: hypothetical protein COA78_25275 [Blastopirellula sp.]|nr:MAG: hypothetical protein COA78_25275 [Blastopirellula sp.]
MADFTNHNDVMKMFAASQDADTDNRQKSRECDLFTSKRDGQWEESWWNKSDGKPRYTIDMTSPIVDQIAGEIEQADFGIVVDPAGGGADKKTAETMNGLVRNIQNISNAKDTFNAAGRRVVNSGFDCWRIVQKFVDSDSFEQDLMIEPIPNAIDRVWFDDGSEKRDRSDSKWAVVMQAFTPADYKAKWPDGSEESLGDDKCFNAYFNKPDLIMVGELYYIKKVERELVLMDNGVVYEDNDEFKTVKKELKALNVKEVKRRKRGKNVVYIRRFDSKGWLESENETVFQHIPVIPAYGNFKIIENKIIYFGVVEKLLDVQRVLNYSLSREIEEGALAPRAKYWMTEKQVGDNDATLETMNTNSHPVQIYNHDPEAPGPPMQQGGAQINPGLRSMSEAMRQAIGQTANQFAASMGDNPNAQSGVALRQLQNKGDIGTIKYFKALEIAINHTCRILINSIPKVYPKDRQVRILAEDGTSEMVTLGEEVLDNETGQTVTLNDLSSGKYDSVCSAGASFQNKQQETVASMIEVAQVDPSIIQLGGDILLNNISAPGMSLMADRKRAQLFQQGLIPPDQWTEEEEAQMQQQAQQPQQPDAMMVAAQAEQAKADAEQGKVQIEQGKLMLAGQKQQFEQQKAEFELMLKSQDAQMAPVKALVEMLNKNADTMQKLGAAAKTIPLPLIGDNIVEQANIIDENQQTL